MSSFRSENEILGKYTQIQWADDSLHYLTGQNDPGFSSGTITASLRALDIEPILSATTSALSSGSNNVTAIRGNLTIASGTTFSTGYLYGTQGKITVKGVVSATQWMAGLMGQLDLSSSGALSNARISPIWADMGATMSSSANSSVAAMSTLLLTNTTTRLINAVITVAADASYLFDLSDLAYGGKHFITTGASGGSNSKCLIVNIDGSPMKIQLYA